MFSRIIVATGIFALSFSLAACAADVPGDDEQETVSQGEVLEAYFGLVSDFTGSLSSDVEALVAENSKAEQFVPEFSSRIDVAESSGLVDKASFTLNYDYVATQEDNDERVVDEVSLCLDRSSYPLASREDFCFIFSEFEFVEGRLAGFETKGDPIHGQIVLAYFGSVAKAQPDDIEKARELAAEGSPAESYAVQQSHVAQADLDSGNFDPYVVELDFEDGVILLDFSAEYSDFVFENNQLVNFSAGDAMVDERLSLYNEEEREIGRIGSLRVLSAYESIGGSLYVTVEVTSDASVLYIPFNATYIAPNGRAMDETWSVQPFELRNERVANAYWIFSGGRVGGELELRFNDQNWREVVVTVPVP